MRKWLFPERCPGCGRVLDMDQSGFCGACQGRLTLAAEPVCKRCGKPLEQAAAELCSDCSQKAHRFIQNKAYCVYEGPAKDAMYRFKYGNAKWVGRVFARELMRTQGRWLAAKQLQAIVPVPMFRQKERERGYNQAAVLAGQLAEKLGIPVLPAVRRVRNTVPQKELSVSIRRKNLKRAFKLDKNVVKYDCLYSAIGRNVCDRILIVDDIYTTGATLDAVCELLLMGRIAREVYAMTAVVGRGMQYRLR